MRAELEGVAAELAAALVSENQLGASAKPNACSSKRSSPCSAGESDRVRVGSVGPTQRNGSRPTTCSTRSSSKQPDDRLRKTIDTLHQSFPRNLTWSALDGDLQLLRENVTQRRSIREAVTRGDGPEARRLMVAHVAYAGNLIAPRAAYGEDGSHREP